MPQEQNGLYINLVYYSSQYKPGELVIEEPVGIGIVPRYSATPVQEFLEALMYNKVLQDKISTDYWIYIQRDGEAKVFGDEFKFNLGEDNKGNLAEVLKMVGTSNIVGLKNTGVEEYLVNPIKYTLESFMQKYLPRITD